MKTLVTIATFDRREDAEKVSQDLQAAGVSAEVEYDDETQKKWLFIEPRASVRVEVEEHEVAKAEALLGAMKENISGLILCPQCRKSRIEYPQLTRKFADLLWIFNFLVKLGYLEPEFYCQHCHYTWPSKIPKPEREKDILNWPNNSAV